MANQDEDLSLWQKTVNAFKAKVNEFEQIYSRLINYEQHAQQSDELNAEYQKLISRGSTLRSIINSTTARIDQAVKWIKGATGDLFSGVEYVPQNEFGFLPLAALAPIAVIAAATAALGKYVSDVYIFERKLTTIESYSQAGMDREKAINLVSKVSENPLIKFGGNKLAILGLLGFGLWYAKKKRLI